jgi:hypothetical protein
VLLKTALSPDVGLLPVQLLPVPQVVLVAPVQVLSVALADVATKKRQARANKPRRRPQRE